MGFFFSDDDQAWDDALRNNAENRNLYEQIKLPEYNEYNPELYSSESFNHELIGEDAGLRSKQIGNLNLLESLASQGLSAEDEAGFAEARNIGAQAARSGSQAAIADANARGVGGGGLEFAMREIANQGGAQRAQSAGLEQAAASARQRALQAQAYQQALSQSRGDDYRVNSANTNIMNDFNAKNTSQRNATSAANTNLRNSAYGVNEGIKDKNYSNQLQQADRRAGMNDRQTEIQLGRQDQNRRNQEADVNQFMGVAQMGMGAYGKK